MNRPPLRNPFPSPRQARELTTPLGWLGVGLGLFKLLAARRVARTLGVPGPGVAVCGARDLATGVAVLRSARPAHWLWLRAGAGALEMVALSQVARNRRGAATGTAVTTLGAVAALALVDAACARALGRGRPMPVADYRDRSGFPQSAARMTGAAREGLQVPRDLRVPAALRPWAGADGPPQRAP